MHGRGMRNVTPTGLDRLEVAGFLKPSAVVAAPSLRVGGLLPNPDGDSAVSCDERGLSLDGCDERVSDDLGKFLEEALGHRRVLLRCLR